MAFSKTKVIGNMNTDKVFYNAYDRNRQARPYVKPLPYELHAGVERDAVNIVEDTWLTKGKMGKTNYYLGSIRAGLYNDTRIAYNNGGTNLQRAIHNKALDKVDEKLQYVGNFFEAWYERREAYSLLGQAGKGLLQFLTSWRKPKYWKSLFKGSKNLVKRPETLPEAWLLANFAIKPLIGTIDDSMRLLCGEFPVLWVEGSSSTKYTTNDYRNEYRFQFQHTYVVKHGVEVTGLNPNAQLLNIMGLTTPFSSFLSVVPWFWAVNYFVNINSMISNFEIRYPGVNIGSSYTTVLHKVNYQGYTRYYAGGWQGYTDTVTSSYDGDFVYMRRKVNNGVPKYKLHFGVPALGSSSFANLFSAIALTFKGKAK